MVVFWTGTVYCEFPLAGDSIEYFCEVYRDIQQQFDSLQSVNQPFC